MPGFLLFNCRNRRLKKSNINLSITEVYSEVFIWMFRQKRYICGYN